MSMKIDMSVWQDKKRTVHVKMSYNKYVVSLLVDGSVIFYYVLCFLNVFSSLPITQDIDQNIITFLYDRFKRKCF
jgi:hypothetical protein